MSNENKNEIIIYQTEDGQAKVEVLFSDKNVWLPLDKIAHLFGRDKSTISRHLKNIFEDDELEQNSVVANFATTASVSMMYIVPHYPMNYLMWRNRILLH